MFANPEANWHSFAFCVPPASHSVSLDFEIFLLSLKREGVRASEVWSRSSPLSDCFSLTHIDTPDVTQFSFNLRSLNALLTTS